MQKRLAWMGATLWMVSSLLLSHTGFSEDSWVQKVRSEASSAKATEAADLETQHLRILVRNHPAPEVSKLLFHDIYESESLAYAFQTDPGLVAAFQESEVTLADKSRKRLPVILVGPELDKLSTDDSIYEAALILFHESIHYQQWKGSDEKHRRWFGQAKLGQPFTKEECEFHWKNEREAYHRECLLALRWGKRDAILPGLCQAANRPGIEFDHQLLSRYLRQSLPVVVACGPRWKELLR